jgi:hypothetical protein
MSDEPTDDNAADVPVEAPLAEGLDMWWKSTSSNRC